MNGRRLERNWFGGRGLAALRDTRNHKTSGVFSLRPILIWEPHKSTTSNIAISLSENQQLVSNLQRIKQLFKDLFTCRRGPIDKDVEQMSTEAPVNSSTTRFTCLDRVSPLFSYAQDLRRFYAQTPTWSTGVGGAISSNRLSTNLSLIVW